MLDPALRARINGDRPIMAPSATASDLPNLGEGLTAAVTPKMTPLACQVHDATGVGGAVVVTANVVIEKGKPATTPVK